MDTRARDTNGGIRCGRSVALSAKHRRTGTQEHEPIETYPLWFFAFGFGLVAWIVARRLWRTFLASEELDRAELEGRLDPDLRRRWNRNALSFVLFVIGTVLLTGWLFYVLNELLRDV